MEMTTLREHVHLMGIGGTGLSAIARILKARGYQVSGCDKHPGPAGEALRALGIPVYAGHDPNHLEGVTFLLRSSAVPPHHPEVEAARRRGLPVYTRSQFLPFLTRGYRTLAVAGTHGKTTTTAMLAWTLLQLGRDPSYIVGGTMVNTGTNGYAGQGTYFVIEADEYDHMFLGLQPAGGILTYVDYDHPDFFPDREAYRRAFRAFVDRFLPQSPLVYWAADEEARRILQGVSHLRVRTYGLEAGSDYRAVEVERHPEGTRFVVEHAGRRLAQVHLPLPGEHNVRNALAVLALVHLLGEDVAAAAQALAAFQGVERRFTVVAEVAGWVLVNDYGHHPVEIATTLEAARQRYPEHRLWAVWQPHTYSRTLRLLPQFAQALRQADGLVVTGVYPAREEAPPDFQEETLFRALDHPRSFRVAQPVDAVPVLLSQVEPPAVVLLFSAGDAPVMLEVLAQALQGGDEAGIGAAAPVAKGAGHEE